MPTPKLTPKQEAFVAEYLISFNAADAARKAGYDPKSAVMRGRKLLADIRIAAAVAEAQKQPPARPPAVADLRSEQDVLDDIRSVTREARDGGDIKTALRGLEVESKLMGMFKDKPENSAPLPPEPPLKLPDNGRR